MTTADDNYLSDLPPKWRFYFDRRQPNLESHQLFWVDERVEDIDDDAIFSILTKFRLIINYTKAFDHWRTCLKYIQKGGTNTFLVCSASYARDILSQLWEFRAKVLWKVYIYYENGKDYSPEWLQCYDKKICSVHYTLDMLLAAIEQDVHEYRNHERAGIFSEWSRAPQQSVDNMYASWWRNFIKVLVSLPYPENYHDRLVAELKLHLGDQPIFNKFQIAYTTHDGRRRGAVWWYTHSHYFYGILNRALRERNVRLLLLYGFFLQDLHRQLTSESHTQSCIVTLYRGQVLSRGDLAKLEIGYSIRSNNFFSMSTDREVALLFLRAADHTGVECVLFETEIDYNPSHHYALFADISQISSFPEEEETLFMTNTWFLVESRQKIVSNFDDLSYTLVKLKPEPDYDMQSDRKLEAGTDRKTVKNCVNALSGMLDMASSEDVNVVFDALMELYSKEAKWILAVKLYCLAILERQRVDENYTVALSYHRRAIAYWEESLYSDEDDELNCSFDIGENYYALGQLYRYRMEDPENLSGQQLEKALDYYELALEKCSATDYDRTDILLKLVKVCSDLEHEHSGKAIKYQEEWLRLMLKEPVLSRKENIANEFRHLAQLYACNHGYDEALSNYEKALEVYCLLQKPSLLYLIHLHRDIVAICIKHKQDFSLALRYELQKHNYELKWVLQTETEGEDALLQSKLNYLAESHFSLADVYMMTEQRTAACEHFIKGLDYSRQRRERLLSEGRYVIRCADGSPLPELLSGADTRLESCELKIKEYEEKLKLLTAYQK